MTFESPEFVTNALILVAAPVLVETVLPLVPIKDLGNGVHERSVFPLSGGKIQNRFSAEIGSDDAILRHADNRFFAINGRLQRFSNVDIKPAFDLLVFRRDGLHDLPS